MGRLKSATVALLTGDRQPDETDRAVIACNDYLRMGPARSLRKLGEKYGKRKQTQAPTEAEGTLFVWSANFGWADRASAYDAERDRERTERRRKEIESGLALDYERINRLKRLAKFLEDQIYDKGPDPQTITIGEEEITIAPSSPYPAVWLEDVKEVAKTKYTILRFNGAILEQFRGILDDLAKEVGDRKQKVDLAHSGSVGFTADEAAQAEAELRVWTPQNTKEQK